MVKTVKCHESKRRMSALRIIDQLLQTLSDHEVPIPMNNIISKSPFKLYTSWFCPFAQRVQLALEVKGLPYEYIDVDPYNKSKDG